jgi:hypothetical protein
LGPFYPVSSLKFINYLWFFFSNRKLAVQGTASKNWLTIVQDYPELASEIIQAMV